MTKLVELKNLKVGPTAHAWLLSLVNADEELLGYEHLSSRWGGSSLTIFAKEADDNGFPHHLQPLPAGLMYNGVADSAHNQLEIAGLIEEFTHRMGGSGRRALWRVSKLGRQYDRQYPVLKLWRIEEQVVAAKVLRSVLAGRFNDWVSMKDFSSRFEELADGKKLDGVTLAGAKRAIRQGVTDGSFRFLLGRYATHSLGNGEQGFSLRETEEVAKLQTQARNQNNERITAERENNERQQRVAKAVYLHIALGAGLYESADEIPSYAYSYSVSFKATELERIAKFLGLEVS